MSNVIHIYYKEHCPLLYYLWVMINSRAFLGELKIETDFNWMKATQMSVLLLLDSKRTMFRKNSENETDWNC